MVVALEAQRLVALRDGWLNPPEWVEWVDEPVPRDEDAAKALKKCTLTNLYNAPGRNGSPMRTRPLTRR